MLPENKREALNRLKTVRGHLDGVIRMVDLATCFSEAVTAGRAQRAIEELVDAVKFSPALTGPDAQLDGAATEPVGASAAAAAGR